MNAHIKDEVTIVRRMCMGQATVSLISQVRELLDGKLVIPSIQRGYVWRKSQVPPLLDSLYRRFPVGALLIWKTNIEVPLQRSAQVSVRTATVHPPAQLLDGQQRLTTLAWLVKPDARPDKVSLDTRFDLEGERFLNPSASQRKDPKLVRVSDILAEGAQFASILERAGVTPTMPEYQEMWERVHRVARIRDYPLTVITHESDDYEEVAEIFARVNQGGRRLSKGDLVHSAIAARWGDGLMHIDAFFDEIDRQSFRINREAILRLMALLAGLGGDHIRLIRPEMTDSRLKSVWQDTEQAVRHAIDFLQGSCHIPRAAVLTSPNLLVLPAYLLFKRKGALLPGEDVLLRRWVYTAMAFSRYSNQVETNLDAEARLVDNKTGPELFTDLTRLARGARSENSPLTPGDLENRYASSPFLHLLYIDALRRGSMDWSKNTPLLDAPMTSSASIEYHHIFPKARVRHYRRELRDSLANLAFIHANSNRAIGAKYPVEYLPQVHAERLAEQHVPTSSELWNIEAFEEFLRQRRETLANVLNEMLDLPPWVPAGDSGGTMSAESDDDEVFVE